MLRVLRSCTFSHSLVESPGGISPPGAPRTVRDPLESHGSRCSAVASGTALPRPQAPPVSSWPVADAEQRNPFAPAPLQGLRGYYGLLRPCAPLRYSRPRAVGAACGLSLHVIGVTRHRFSRSIRKPGRAARRRHAGCRSGSIRASPELIPEEGSPPVLTSPNPLSTLLQRFACARLSRPCLPKSGPGVSATLTTTAFVRSSLRWLEIGS